MSKKLTRFGFEKLQAEYEDLLYSKRPKVVQGVTNAAAEGDRSENAEYTYGKKRLREIDKRLGYLAALLKGVQVVDIQKLDLSRVNFGAWVEIEDSEGQVKSFRIVGEGETYFYPDAISERSPMAQGLLGKKLGDVGEVHRPKGVMEFEVKKIEAKA